MEVVRSGLAPLANGWPIEIGRWVLTLKLTLLVRLLELSGRRPSSVLTVP